MQTVDINGSPLIPVSNNDILSKVIAEQADPLIFRMVLHHFTIIVRIVNKVFCGFTIHVYAHHHQVDIPLDLLFALPRLPIGTPAAIVHRVLVIMGIGYFVTLWYAKFLDLLETRFAAGTRCHELLGWCCRLSTLLGFSMFSPVVTSISAAGVGCVSVSNVLSVVAGEVWDIGGQLLVMIAKGVEITLMMMMHQGERIVSVCRGISVESIVGNVVGSCIEGMTTFRMDVSVLEGTDDRG